jgi:hypothetical protein
MSDLRLQMIEAGEAVLDEDMQRVLIYMDDLAEGQLAEGQLASHELRRKRQRLLNMLLHVKAQCEAAKRPPASG